MSPERNHMLVCQGLGESIRSTVNQGEIISAGTGKGRIETDQTPRFREILVPKGDKEKKLALCIPCFKGGSLSTANLIFRHWQVCQPKSPIHRRFRSFCKMKFYPVYQDEYVKKRRGNEMATPARAAGMSGVSVEEEQLMRGEPSAQRSGLTSVPAQLQRDHLIRRLIFNIQNHYIFPGVFFTCCFLSGAVLFQILECRQLYAIVRKSLRVKICFLLKYSLSAIAWRCE